MSRGVSRLETQLGANIMEQAPRIERFGERGPSFLVGVWGNFSTMELSSGYAGQGACG